MGKRIALCLPLTLTVMLLLFLPARQRDSIENILHEGAVSYSFSLANWHLKNLPPKLVSFVSNVGEIPLHNISYNVDSETLAWINLQLAKMPTPKPMPILNPVLER